KIGRGERQGVRAIGRCRGFGRRRNGRRFGRLRKGFGRGGGGDRGLRRFAFAAPLPVLVRRLGRGGGGTVGAGDRIPGVGKGRGRTIGLVGRGDRIGQPLGGRVRLVGSRDARVAAARCRVGRRDCVVAAN